MKKWSLFFIILCLFGCIEENHPLPPTSYVYPNGEAVSDINGMPLNSETFYFPQAQLPDSLKGNWRYELQDFSNQWYSRVLYRSGEPVLFNQYIHRELYRFTWLRSFKSDVILILEKTPTGIILIEKEVIQKAIPDIDGGHKLDYHLISTRMIPVKEGFWNQFNDLVEEKGFHNMPMYKQLVGGSDGAEWILEKHGRTGYHVVNRWTPREHRYAQFRLICDQLIDISSFSDEQRY